MAFHRTAYDSLSDVDVNHRLSAKKPFWKCSTCGKQTSSVCGGCFEIAYCCKEHQKKHWTLEHKKYCRPRHMKGVTPEPCENVSNCGHWYFPGEHEDPEYCNREHCGRKFPEGVCWHIGRCKCEVICNDWVTFALRILWRTRYGDAAETVCEEGFLADVAKCA